MDDLRREILLKKLENFFKEREMLMRVKLEESKFLDKHILYIAFVTLGFLLKYISEHSNMFSDLQKVLLVFLCILLAVPIILALENLYHNKEIFGFKEKLLNLELEIVYKLLLSLYYKSNGYEDLLVKTVQDIRDLEEEKLKMKKELEKSLNFIALKEREGEMIVFLVLGIIALIFIIGFSNNN